MSIIKEYVDYFNQNDNELYKNAIDNAHAAQWLENEIPVFECPDKEMEMIYYFRWWTLRKHVKKNDEGYVITEFLPDVPWSGKYNVINAAAGHHLYEGRWLSDSKKYFEDYISFFLNNPEDSMRYSTWFIHGILEFYRASGDAPKDRAFIGKLCEYYERWEQEHGLENGMFWSVDDRDAMEYTIAGTWDQKPRKGIRPTLNSYMCADAYALSVLAENAGMKDIAEKYKKKHEALKNQINEILWDGELFKPLHYEEDDYKSALNRDKKAVVRELIDYIPWYFDLADGKSTAAFKYLDSTDHFYTDYGITTAEQNNPRFLYEVDHECLWNGYVWPFAISQTLTALKNACMANPSDKNLPALFCKLLSQYASIQYITTDDGRRIPWIDEVKHPLRDEWSSRAILEDWGWKPEVGGRERGKDYNHSTFCDLVITGIVGVDTKAGEFTVNPIIPETWEYFKLENLTFRGSKYTVIYDKNNKIYGYGKGITILKDGKNINF